MVLITEEENATFLGLGSSINMKQILSLSLFGINKY